MRFVFAILAVLLLSGCGTTTTEPAPRGEQNLPQTPASKPPPQAPTTSSNNSNVLAMFKRLRVADENTSGYDRDLFPHWSDLDGNGCDTREDVLYRDSRQKSGSCYDESGVWISAYDGERTTDPSSFDVDHMVPLSEAWDSGAYGWPEAKREAYANDMHPWSLIAVTAESNRSKSDQDPSDWMPENTAFTCAYIARWIAVKFRWRLTIDSDEKSSLQNYLNACPKAALRLDAKVVAVPKPNPAPQPQPNKKPVNKQTNGKTDPRFPTCSVAVAKGYGPYIRGRDKEYGWYTDGDGDGRVCE